jgi:hypothetical protein
MSISAELLTLAKKVVMYEAYAAAGTTYWTSTTVFKATVPTGKRWIVLGGMIYRSQNATVIAQGCDASDHKMYQFVSEAAAQTLTTFPNRTASAAFGDYSRAVLDPTDYIQFTFGAAQDTNAYITLVVLEVDV